MKTLGVRRSTHDLDWTVTDGLESVEQRVEQRLRFFQRTWFLALQEGVPYLEDVLIRQADAGLAERALADAAADVSGVEEVISVNVTIGPVAETDDDPRLRRRSSAEIELRTDAGNLQMAVPV